MVKERPVLEISYRKTEDLLHPHTYSVAFISGNYDKISLSTNLYHMTETQRKWWSRDENYNQIYNATLLTNKNGTKCGLQDKTLLKYLLIFVNQNETRTLFRLTIIIIILQYFCFLSVSSGAASGRTVQTQVTSLPQSPPARHYEEDAAAVVKH